MTPGGFTPGNAMTPGGFTPGSSLNSFTMPHGSSPLDSQLHFSMPQQEVKTVLKASCIWQVSLDEIGSAMH